jgi:hypothetical protein
MASPIGLGVAAAAFSLFAGSALACPDVAACGGMSAHYGYYSWQASFGPMVDGPTADYEPGPYGMVDSGPPYGDDQGDGYGPPPPAAGDPAYYDGPPPAPDAPGYYDAPAYDGAPAYYGAQQGGGSYAGSSYSSRGYAGSSRSSSASFSESGYDSGWQRVPGPPPAAGYGGHHYGAVSVREGSYDSGWRIREGRPEVWCPPGSRFARPHPRYGCGVAEAGVAPSFFYDTGGVGPAFIGGGGGGGGGGVVIVGGGVRAGAFASARASASVRVGVHGGFHGRGGCGCGGHHGGRH